MKREPIKNIYIPCDCGDAQDYLCEAKHHYEKNPDVFEMVGEEFDEGPQVFYDTLNYVLEVTGACFLFGIRDRKLIDFQSLTNDNYRNDAFPHWQWERRRLLAEPSAISDLVQAEARATRHDPPRRVKPLNLWRLNGGLFRHDMTPSGVVDSKAFELFFAEVASNSPDVDVIVNRRDFPLVKKDLKSHPFEDTFGVNFPHNYPKKMMPVLTGSCDPVRYKDILMPHWQDLERALFQDKNIQVRQQTYHPITKTQAERKGVAVFRGSWTGTGTTEEFNDRLWLVMQSLKYPDMIDAKFVKVNARPRCHVSKPFHIQLPVHHSEYLGQRLTLQQQSDMFKYIVNVDGHVSAYRLSEELSSDCVVLKMESTYQVWYSHLLIPHEHYIPVTRKNLLETIRFCRKNPDICENIVKEANKFVKTHLNWSSMVRYGQALMTAISAREPFCFPPNGMEIQTRDILQRNMKDLIRTESLLSSNLAVAERDFSKRPKTHRTFALLSAQRHIFATAMTLEGMKPFKPVKRNGKVVVNFLLYQGCWPFVKKESIVPLEYEVAVGLKVNALCKIIPNFMYTFGFKDGCAWVEWISELRLTDWIADPPKNSSGLTEEEKLAMIFIQTCEGGRVADDFMGFRHGDCVHRNVMVQTLPEEKSFDYPAGMSFRRIYTNDIPIFIDYEKSDVCHFDNDKACILPLMAETVYKGETYDVVSLILSLFEMSLTKSEKAFTPRLAKVLIDFAAECLDETRFNLDDSRQRHLFVTHYTHRSVRERKSHKGKMSTLVDRLLVTFPNLNDKCKMMTNEPMELRMAENSPLYIYHMSHVGETNRKLALAILSTLQEKSRPVFETQWQLEFQSRLIEHQYQTLKSVFEQFPDLDDLFEKCVEWRRYVDVERKMKVTLDIPSVNVKSGLDLYVKEDCGGGIILDDWITAFNTVKMARFFLDRTTMEGSGVEWKIWKDRFTFAAGSYFIKMAAQNYTNHFLCEINTSC